MKVAQEEEKTRIRHELAEKIVLDRQQKQIELERHYNALAKMHDELEMKHANWCDVQNYKKEEAQHRRQSVAMRLDSWRNERIVEEMIKSQEAVIAEEDVRLKEQDWMDLMTAKENLKFEEKQSRMLGGFM